MTIRHSGKDLGVPDWATVGTALNADWCHAILKLSYYEDLGTPAELVKARECAFCEIDEESDTWSCSNCSYLWTFSYDGPEENEMNYCPKCGAKITKLLHYPDEEEE